MLSDASIDRENRPFGTDPEKGDGVAEDTMGRRHRVC
jgi:hypothetical protein